jgi:hypothetical protein
MTEVTIPLIVWVPEITQTIGVAVGALFILFLYGMKDMMK